MTCLSKIEAMHDPIDAQATAFAHLLGMSGNDADAAFSKAFALADGLFPHQVEGVAFLLGRRRAILADDMGLGKTRQAIVSLRHMAPTVRTCRVPRLGEAKLGARNREVAPDATILVMEGRRPRRLTHHGPSSTTTFSGAMAMRSSGGLGRPRVRRGALPEESHERAQQARSRVHGPRKRQLRAPLVVQLLTGTPLTSRPRDPSCCCSSPAIPSDAASSHSPGAIARRRRESLGGRPAARRTSTSSRCRCTASCCADPKTKSGVPPKLRTWLPVQVPARPVRGQSKRS